MCDCVIYTANIGGYDLLQPVSRKEVPHVCFSDQPIQDAPGWDVRLIVRQHQDARYEARWYKTHPQIVLSDAKYTIWIDAHMMIITAIWQIIDAMKENQLLLFAHPWRDCAYQEANVCLADARVAPSETDRQRIRSQLAHMQKEGYPEHFGLAETSLLARLNSRHVIGLNEFWWQEIAAYSHRDQISFDYCCWKLGVKYTRFPANIRNHPWISYKAHSA